MSNQTEYELGGLYRSRRPMLFGVCGGIAEYFDISRFWTRMFTFIALWLTGFFPVGFLYICAALLMKKQPLLPTGYDPVWHARLNERRERPAGSFDERLNRVRNAARA